MVIQSGIKRSPLARKPNHLKGQSQPQKVDNEQPAG